MRALVFTLFVLAGCTDPEAGGGVSTAGPYVPASGEATVFPDLEGTDLLGALDREFSPTQTLGYGRARDALFAYEMETDGALEAVYTGYAVALPPGADPTAAASALGINTEHVWPQSYGARAEPLRSDLHHLFPAREGVNSSRGNLPFGEIDDRRTDAWYRLDVSQANAPSADRDAWSERGAGRFEPRESREGDVARAVFYVVALYPEAVDRSFFETMRADLLDWNDGDPPDDAERARSDWIASVQGTANPFVLDPTLARRAFGAASGPSTDGGVSTAGPISAPEAGALQITEIHYDNAGEDVGEGAEVAGPPGTPLDGWTLTFYNGNGGRVYETRALAGTMPASGAVWVDVPGLQNGSPDGLALVAPGGSVAQFLSYEGTFAAADGPAQGRMSTDIEAAEGGDTRPGRSLRLESGAWVPGEATPGRR